MGAVRLLVEKLTLTGQSTRHRHTDSVDKETAQFERACWYLSDIWISFDASLVVRQPSLSLG